MNRLCSVCSGTNIVCMTDGVLYCCKHRTQMSRYGKIVETMRDKNLIILKNTHAVIIIKNKKFEIIGKCLVDKEDLKELTKYKWCINESNYVLTSINRKKIRMHRMLLKPKKYEIIDHINRNPLDNRRCNLRIANHSENSLNSKIPKNNSSGIVGVHFSKKRKKWIASFKKNNIRKNKYFSKKEDAIKRRKESEKEYIITR